ncbi:SurA N-terminal domain-containing protein [Saccharospirillum impatiens]|uniref:SurA N-terminal domain-containing protein n=1 Tax=Saccharospirillum impatiens TaxID=169438 RepID=UPI000422937A|nr:SurA N-terminal domain-containing protein [Saccharospirillum impatiens]
MLQFFRNAAKGVTGKVIVAVIVVAFAFFGAESIVGVVNNSDPIEVNGEGISDVQVQRLVQERQQQLIQQLGENATPELLNSSFIRQSVVNALVNEEIQRQATVNLDLAVSEEAVNQNILSIGAFQSNGRFDEEAFRRYIATNGFTPTTFRSQLSSQIRLEQMQAGLVRSAFELDRDVERSAALENQRREVTYRRYNAEDFLGQVDVSEQDVQAYYDSNSDQFLNPEQVQVRYVVLNQSDLIPDMVVTESDIDAEYNRYVSDAESETLREVAHILFADDDDPMAAAEEARARLDAGESFADLAGELSDDPGSSLDGGFLGELSEGLYVDEFYDAGQQLQNVGDVSDPVQTEFGVHLIRLETLEQASVEPLDNVRDSLEQAVRERKARAEFGLLETEMADIAFQSDQVEEVAESFNTPVQTSDWINRNSTSGVAASAAFVTAAFSETVVDNGLISDVVRLENGGLAVLQLEAYEPEQVKPLASVRDQIVDILTNEQATDLAEQAATDDLSQVRAEGAVTSELWVAPTVVDRDNSELPSNLVQFSFEMPRPAAGGLAVERFTAGETVYLVAVLSVTEGEVTDDVRQSVGDYLAQRTGQADYQSFFNALRTSADVQISGALSQ